MIDFPFKHRLVRDLAWVISSPPLVSGNFNEVLWWDYEKCLAEYRDCFSALLALDQNPHALISHLENLKSKRLGLRFEALVSFWLSSISPNYTLLAQNIQLHEIPANTQSRTIGEIDFIIEDRHSGDIIHLEVAVKFYLGTAPFDDPYRWFGTNLNDQLGRKIEHLKQHQTQLSIKHPTQMPRPIHQRHCLVKGRLFYPMDENIAPQGVSANHLRARWLYQQESSGSEALIPLQKSEWLSKFTNEDIQKHKTQKQFTPLDRPQCYVSIEQDTDATSKERERVFCLPESFQFPSASSDK